MVSYETYSSGRAELDGWTDDQSTMMGKKTIAGMIEILRKLDRESPYLETIEWTFYGKGLPGEAEGVTKAIRMLKQRMKSSSLMKEWVELHEDFRTARAKFIQAEIGPNNVDSVLTRFKTLSRQQKIKDPNEKNIDWWVKIDSNAKTEEERKELLFQKFIELRDFVTRKEKERTITQVKNKKIQGQSYKLYEDDTWLVIVPLNHDAACFYGKYTDWCISKPKNMYFDIYTNRDKLMFTILYNKKYPHDNSHYAIAWVVYSESEVEFVGFWDSEDNQYTINDGTKELKLAEFPLSIEKIQKILESKLENIIENGWGGELTDEEYDD